MGVDANVSTVIDSKGGLRALLPHVIRYTYREKAKDPKFLRDIYVRQTIPFTANVGACPDSVMREYLKQAEFQDEDGSLIAYLDYNIDLNQKFDQLGYVVMSGNNFNYSPPSPTTSYTGDMFVSVPSYPEIPGDPNDPIPFPSDATADDVVINLALAIRGDIKFEDA